MMPKTRLLFSVAVVIASVFFLAGCASVAEEMLAGYQCEREAANRPDQVQREAECQNALNTTPRREP